MDLSSQVSLLPEKPGVYIYKDEAGKILYVGKAKSLKKRVASYFLHKNTLENKTAALVSQIHGIEHIVVESEIEAFLLEATLIKKYKPFYNIKLLDDKFFPYVKITKNDNPAVLITRKTGEKNATYFGPYTNVTDLKIVLKIIRKIFPYQSVANHPKRTCLYYHLGLCPCTPAKLDNMVQYKKNLRNISAFLDGKKDQLIKNLQKEQKEYVRDEEFEKAAEIQKQIERINLVTSEHYDPFHYEEKPDAYFEKIDQEISSLREILLPYYPDLEKLERIECYDISNIQGKHATGSMVVFAKGQPDKNSYRRFKIKAEQSPNDFLMMKEVMERRLKRGDWARPDLMIIDGGKGQVSSVMQIMRMAGSSIPVIGLAKREEIIVVPIMNGNKVDSFMEIKLPHRTPGINLIRRIRDEAHRFAITYHRLLRKKYLLQEVR